MQLQKLLFLTLVFLFPFLGIGQVKKESLKKVIADIENQHQVSFNYTAENIVHTVFYNPEKELNEILISLEKQTQLRFEKLKASKKIIIRPFKDSDTVSICAYVIENDFAGANIEIQSVLKVSNAAVTDTLGYFTINNIEFSDHLILRKEGVFLKKVLVSELYQNHCPKIKVSTYQQQLQEIKIKNYLAKGVSKSEQKVTLKPNDFEVLAGNIEPDVIKNLEHIPGVQSPFEMASKIHVRGGSSDQNLVLWNGIKTYSQSHFYGLLSAFNPYVVEQVDFYNKGISPVYGDRLSSVIDIQSSKKVVDSLSAGAGANLLYADAFMKLPVLKEKLSIEFSARRSFTDFWQSPAYTPMAERIFQNTNLNAISTNATNDFYFLDYNVGVQATISKKDALHLNTIYAINDLDFNSNSEVNDFSDTFSAVFSEKQKTENEGYSLQWQHTYSNTLKQYTKINLANYILDAEYAITENDLEEERTESQKNFVQDYGAQTYLDISFLKDKKLQFGYEFSNNKVRYSIENQTADFSLLLDEQSNILKTHSLFADFKWHKPESYILNLGVRANKYSTSDSYFVEPRFYGELSIFPKFSINGSASLTSQAVTQIQNSLTNISTLGNFLWRIADEDDFNILRSSHFSFGGLYTHRSWFVEFDGYVKQTKNITSLNAGFLNPIDNEFNIGENSTLGGELFLKKKFKRYATWISYAYTNQKTKYDTVNNGEYFASNLNIEHTFKWLHFLEFNKLQFSLSWLWHTGRSITDVNAIKEEGKPVVLFFDEINDSQLPEYHKLDASVLYNLKTKNNHKWQIGLSVQNIYNRKSIVNREFRTTPGIDNTFFLLNYNSIGFTPNASLRFFW